MRQYSDIPRTFDFNNIDTAVRIGWCESRGKSDAHRTDNKDKVLCNSYLGHGTGCRGLRHQVG